MLQPGGDQMLRAEVLTAQLRSGGAACVGYASGYSVVSYTVFSLFHLPQIRRQVVLSVTVSVSHAAPRLLPAHTEVVSYTLH